MHTFECCLKMHLTIQPYRESIAKLWIPNEQQIKLMKKQQTSMNRKSQATNLFIHIQSNIIMYTHTLTRMLSFPRGMPTRGHQITSKDMTASRMCVVTNCVVVADVSSSRVEMIPGAPFFLMSSKFKISMRVLQFHPQPYLAFSYVR